MKNNMLINLVVCDPNIGIENIEGFDICIDNNDYIFSLLSIQKQQDEQELDDHSVIVKTIGLIFLGFPRYATNYKKYAIVYH